MAAKQSARHAPSANEIYQLSDSSGDEGDARSRPAVTRKQHQHHADDIAQQDIIELDTYDSDDQVAVSGSSDDSAGHESGEFHSTASSSDTDDAVMSFSSDEDLDSNVSDNTATHSAVSSQRKRNTSLLDRIVGEGTVEPSPAKRRSTVRYFAPADTSIKCWNCNESGHQSSQCPHEKMYKPCWICGLRGHAPSKCDQSLCFNCFGVGHQRHECPNARINTMYCYQCGSTAHTAQQCTLNHREWKNDLTMVRCYVCGAEGHICCSQGVKSSAPTPLYCANCASTGHSYLDCRQSRMETVIAVNNSGEPRNANDDDSDSSSSNRRQSRRLDERVCFRCGQAGHIARDCPTATAYTPDRQHQHSRHRAASESRYAANVRRFAQSSNYRSEPSTERHHSYNHHTPQSYGAPHHRQGRSRERDFSHNNMAGQPRSRYYSQSRYR